MRHASLGCRQKLGEGANQSRDTGTSIDNTECALGMVTARLCRNAKPDRKNLEKESRYGVPVGIMWLGRWIR